MKNIVYVGTYTRGASEGIYVFERNPANGNLTPRHTVRDVFSPSFLAFDPRQRLLFAVNESNDYEEKEQGAVSSFRIESDGNLTFLSKQPTLGGDPCHLSTDSSGKWLVVANHEHGNAAVFPIADDGKLAPAGHLEQHKGSGPGPTQKGPHAHCVALDPSRTRLMVVDKGIDKVMVYRVENGKLVPNDPPFGQLHVGAAPRHIAFHPNGRYAYINGEADLTITAFEYDGANGAFRELHYLSTLPEGASRERGSTAQIVVEPSGRYVYVSNRGHDSIAMFAIDQATGRVTALGHEPTQGRTPRNFQVDPEGRFLYAANQNTDTIVVFEVDRGTGRLQATGEIVSVPTPVCIIFGT